MWSYYFDDSFQGAKAYSKRQDVSSWQLLFNIFSAGGSAQATRRKKNMAIRFFFFEMLSISRIFWWLCLSYLGFNHLLMQVAIELHFDLVKSQQWFTSVSHTRSWLCYFLLWDRKWRSHPGRGEKWVRDRDRLFIFCPITSQLRVWDTDVSHCCVNSQLNFEITTPFNETMKNGNPMQENSK